MRTVLKLNPALPDLLAQLGIGITEFADRCQVSRATVFALLNPAQHSQRRGGGMHRTTAWHLARTFAEFAGVDKEAAYRTIIIESTRVGNPRKERV